MGEAKRRGTREQRKQNAPAKPPRREYVSRANPLPVDPEVFMIEAVALAALARSRQRRQRK